MENTFPFQNLSIGELLNLFDDSYTSGTNYESLLFDHLGLNISNDFDADPDENFFNEMTLNPSDYCSQFQLENLATEYKSNKLSFIFHNIRSIPKNLDNFYSIHLNNLSNQFDFMSFCETRLTDDVCNLYKLDNYNIFTNCRDSKGGGVAVYANCKFNCTVLCDISLMNESIESLFVEYTVNSKKRGFWCNLQKT